MNKALGISIALLLLGSQPSRAEDVAPGKRLFDRHCAECHAAGFGYPGTQQLGWTRGEKNAVLEERKDLLPAYVTLVVRNGLLEMPAFRPTEIDDSQLQQLVDYLTRKKR